MLLLSSSSPERLPPVLFKMAAAAATAVLAVQSCVIISRSLETSSSQAITCQCNLLPLPLFQSTNLTPTSARLTVHSSSSFEIFPSYLHNSYNLQGHESPLRRQLQ